MSKLTVSPTGLSRYFQCPRKFELARKYTAKYVPKWMELGTMVHKILETGEMPPLPSSVAWKAIRLAKDISEFMAGKGYVLTESEFTERVPLPIKGVTLVRKLDAKGTFGSDPIFVDFKVPNYKWDTIGGIAPKAQGFQSVAYTYGREDTELHYIVAPSDGTPTKAFPYERRPEDDAEFLEAVSLFKTGVSKDYFPAFRGWQCKNCEFAAACYETDGWEKQYEERN